MREGGETEPDVTPAGEAERQHFYKVLSAAALVVVSSGTVVYHYLEGWSWVDSLYFSVVAVTTVGFGDLTPTTDGAKLFTVLYILTGISILGLFLNERLKRAGRRRVERARRRRGSDDQDR